jgi:hypothetical protein
MGGDRGEVHDGAATAPQRRKGGASQPNRAHQHQVDGFGPRGIVQVRYGAEDGPSGVVDEHVEAAERCGRPLGKIAALVSLPEIGDPCDDVMTFLLERFGGGLDALLIAR